MGVEILSPAGSVEHLKYAVLGGADGVYLGTKEFSARSSAVNFTMSELEESVEFCHTYGVSVYVAVNTLIKNSELSELVSLVQRLGEINVDGVIIQDLAVAEIFKKICPQMPLHASTQMAVHNLQGALALKEMGFSRVVLARELDFDEIEYITKNCGIETEVFVHGAHCMSASGMCYLSSFIGGRSGNRGKCAQPCRLDFKSENKSFCLSLKDMCYVDYVEKLKDAGVASLKIEGRMKRPEYAYIASKTYKKAKNGEDFEKELKLLKGVFSRSGFTDGYIAKKRDGNMFGFRQKEDVQASTSALKEIKPESENKIPVSFTVDIEENKPICVKAVSKGKSVFVFSEQIVDKETLLPSEERIESAFSKTGNTPFCVENILLNINVKSENTNKAFSISAFNELRRNAVEALKKELSKRDKKEIYQYCLPKSEKKPDLKKRSEIRIRVEKSEQTEEISDFKGKIIIPYTELLKKELPFEKDNIIAEIPLLVYPFSEKNLLSSLKELYEKGYKNALCENIAFIDPLTKMGFKIYGGAYLNIINPVAFLEYEKMGVWDITLSPEINSGDIPFFTTGTKGVIAYGFLPLMNMRNCPLKASKGCEKCGGRGVIKDRLNKEFSVLCKKEFVSLLNTVPISLSGKELFVDFHTLYFTKESKKQVKTILNQFIKGEEPNYPHTKGLYFRKVL